MRIKYYLALLVLTVILVSTNTGQASATTWDKFINGDHKTLGFYIYEDPYLIPCPVVVSGCWKEYWDGTQGGWATLQPLYHCAIIHNWDPNAMSWIDDFAPWANYNDGNSDNTWDIVYPYAWILRASNKMYNDGYNNPGTYYNNPNVNGCVWVYGSDSMQMQMEANWYWVQ